jgi:hypothetical protein
MYSLQSRDLYLGTTLSECPVLHISEWNDSDRKQSIDDHIAANDYFATIATVIDLIKQFLEEHGDKEWTAEQMSKHLAELRDEHLYLQEHYTLHRKRTIKHR